MIRRLAGSTPSPRMERFGERPGGAMDWIAAALGLKARQDTLTPAALKRRRTLSALLIAYLVLVVAATAWFNFPVLLDQSSLRATVEKQAELSANMGRTIDQIESEGRRAAELRAQREETYRQLPDVANLPLILRRLEAPGLGLAIDIHSVSYTEPRWTGDVGHMPTQVQMEGSLADVLAYLAAIDKMLPTALLYRVDLQRDEMPGWVTATMDVSVAVLKDRPKDVPTWSQEEALERAAEAARSVAEAGLAFSPTAELWRRSSEAGIRLPQLKVVGIGQRSDEAVALLAYGGATKLVRAGDRLDAITVVRVDAGGVELEIGGRTSYLRAGGNHP